MKDIEDDRQRCEKIIRQKRGVGKPAAKRLVSGMDDLSVRKILGDPGVDFADRFPEVDIVNDDANEKQPGD